MVEPIATVGDLAGICGHDGTNWEKILIDSSKRLVIAIASAIAQECQLYGWDGDSWEKLQVDANKYLKVTLPIEEALGARAYNYDGATWRRANLLWGYHDSYGEEVDEISVGAGSTVVVGSSVPEGEVWKVEAIAVYHNDTVAREVSMNVNVNTENIGVAYDTSLDPLERLFWNGAVTLAEGDYVRVVCVALASGKYIRVQAVGYKMDIEM